MWTYQCQVDIITHSDQFSEVLSHHYVVGRIDRKNILLAE